MLKKICFISSSRSECELVNLLNKKSKNFFRTKLLKISNLYNEKNNIKSFSSQNIILKKGTSRRKFILENFNYIIKKASEKFIKFKPHLVVLIGDRYEMFASSIAAFFLNIPCSHIAGGEITQGSMDDFFRNAMTKLSKLHFVEKSIYKKRVLQLGESSKRIFNVGSLNEELIAKNKYIRKKKLEKELSINLWKNNVLVCYHSNTNSISKTTFDELNVIFSVVKYFQNILFIFTSSNSDFLGQVINKKIIKFTKKNKNCCYFDSLGSQKFLSLLKLSNLILGNSSSGVTEAPYIGTPTINCGDRQTGRYLYKSVISCKFNKTKIIQIVNQIINRNKKKKYIIKKINVSNKIIKILKKNINILSINKKFIDLK